MSEIRFDCQMNRLSLLALSFIQLLLCFCAGINSCGAQIRPRINGLTTIITPQSLIEYTVLPSTGIRVVWQTVGSGITINSSDTENPVKVSLIGRGENMLIATIVNEQNQLVTDTFKINKNNCSAVAGNARQRNLRICTGQAVSLSLDGAIGSNIIWQESVSSNVWYDIQAFNGQPFPEFKSNLLYGSRNYRAVVSNGLGCSDTSEWMRIEVVQPPEALIRYESSSFWCTNQSSGTLKGVARYGTGEWFSDGSGNFSNPKDGSSDYIPSEADGAKGRINIRWQVVNDVCASNDTTFSRAVQFSPKARFDTQLSPVCAGARSQALAAEIISGKGRWIVPEGSLGSYLEPNDPNTQFIPHRDDAGKTLELGWLAENNSCDTLLTQKLQIIAAPVARVAFPESKEDATVCRDDLLRLRADTSGRRGNYFWSSNQPLSGRPDQPFVNARPQNEPARYFLTFIELFSGCRTSDTVYLYIKPRSGNLPESAFRTCPDQPLELLIVGLDTTQPANWIPPTGLSSPFDPVPTFITEENDTIFQFVLEGRSLSDGCTYRTPVRIDIEPAPQPRLVDLSNEQPFRLCFGYPNLLFYQDTAGCTERWIFKGNRNEVREKGRPSPQHPNYVGADTLRLDSLPVSALPYSYTSHCRSTRSNCTRFDEIQFRIVEVPVARFEPERSLVPFNDRSIKLNNLSERATNFSWDFGDPTIGVRNNSQQFSPTHEFARPGRYTLTLVADNGVCSKASFREIEVLGEDYFFPEAFTPDHDGLNDIFRPLPAFWQKDQPDAKEQIEQIDMQKFQIFDLSQNTVFEINSAEDWKKQPGWGGLTQDGRAADPGVYLYRAVIQQIPYGETIHTGRVTLIR